MTWYGDLGFEADPYEALDPLEISPQRIEWNRDDLPRQRRLLNAFLEDVETGHRAGLVAYGAIGAGKTWLSKVIEGEYRSKLPDGVVLSTKVEGLEPTFDVIYTRFITSFLSDERILRRLKQAVGEHQGPWRELFPNNRDLGNALFHIVVNDLRKPAAENWLAGMPVSVNEARSADIMLKLGTYSQKYDVMRALLRKCVELFPGVLLLIDELENATAPLAKRFGDALRDLIDSFSEKFAICLFFTGQSMSLWQDFGYSETLLSRIRYQMQLDSIQPASAAGWLRRHNATYRKKGAKVKDQLEPFTKDGLDSLLSLTDPDKMYPRYVLTDCQSIARALPAAGRRLIDKKFVRATVSVLREAQSTSPS